MNSAMRFVALSAAACALASAFAADAYGRQAQQNGNSAEAARLERQRQENEMREADLREREFMLRNMRPDRRRTPAPRLDLSQIKLDFMRLQVIDNELAEAVSRGGTLDLKFVSKSADEIRKLAARLKGNLMLPAPAAEEKRAEQKAALYPPPPAQLNAALSELDQLILKFVDGVASKGVYRLDANSSARARQELEAIIETSARVKKASESSVKSTP